LSQDVDIPRQNRSGTEKAKKQKEARLLKKEKKLAK
jgi:hypothetical protein